MGVKPGQLVGRGASQGDPHNRIVGVENYELCQELFRLPPGVGGGKKWSSPIQRP